jgi:hypothetical protein
MAEDYYYISCINSVKSLLEASFETIVNKVLCKVTEVKFWDEIRTNYYPFDIIG